MGYEWAALGIGLAGLGGWLVKAWPVCRTMWHGRCLSRVRTNGVSQMGRLPRVSVIVPACDEEGAIRRCLESLVGQDYPDLEIVAINDRSSDGTGAIMDQVAAASPRVGVEHIKELPAGWLGKNHANAVGAERATGDWLLFTDGDVFFESDCVRRAVTHAEAEGLDHLALFPALESTGYWERAACCFFGMLIAVSLQTWHTRNPLKPQAFCGIGAFNLVRRRAYQAVGTHQRLRMEVADDITLGKLLKQGGYVSDVMSGRLQVAVRWQVGLGGVVRGLEKNAFCGAAYSVPRATAGVIVLTLLSLLPAVGAVLAPGWTRIAYAAWLLSQMGSLAIGARAHGFSRLVGLAFPIAALTLALAIGRSMILTLWRGGIRWRGTFYPLEQLREGHL